MKDEDYIDGLFEAKKEFNALHRDTLAKIRELKKETDSNFQHTCRIEYLAEEMTETIANTFALFNGMEAALLLGQHNTVYMINEHIREAITKALRLQAEVLERKKLMTGAKPEGITDEMIERAREYPISDMIEFRRNMARCIFHDDKNPSMELKKDNRVFCYSCNKGFDAIDVYCELHNVKFTEAVRAMQ